MIPLHLSHCRSGNHNRRNICFSSGESSGLGVCSSVSSSCLPSSVSRFPTFINITCDARARRANPRDIWARPMCGSLATTKACLPAGRPVPEEPREGTGSQRCERNPGNEGRARLTPRRCHHLLSPRADGELGSLICPFLTGKPPQPQAMPSTCTLVHPKLTARTQQVINNGRMKNNWWRLNSSINLPS